MDIDRLEHVRLGEPRRFRELLAKVRLGLPANS